MAINTTTAATMINDIEERIKIMKRIFLVADAYDHTITFKVGLEHAGFEVDALMSIMIQQSHCQISSRITTIYR